MERLPLTNKELFLAGHKELINLVHWFSIPSFEVPRSSRLTLESITEMSPASIYVSDSGTDLRSVNKLDDSVTAKIISTFCESHLRLKNE